MFLHLCAKPSELKSVIINGKRKHRTIKLLTLFVIEVFVLSATVASTLEQTIRSSPEKRAIKMSEKMEKELGSTTDQLAKYDQMIANKQGTSEES